MAAQSKQAQKLGFKVLPVKHAPVYDPTIGKQIQQHLIEETKLEERRNEIESRGIHLSPITQQLQGFGVPLEDVVDEDTLEPVMDDDGWVAEACHVEE